jgi:sirohydrochlorin ferrochelatase
MQTPSFDRYAGGVRAVLLVDHGSRLAEANAIVERIAERVRLRLPEHLVAIAHMEQFPPGVEEAFERLVGQGATDVVVHPYFLAPGRHSSRDIPALAERAASRHPGLRVRVGKPLGVHDGVVEAVLARVREAGD